MNNSNYKQLLMRLSHIGSGILWNFSKLTRRPPERTTVYIYALADFPMAVTTQYINHDASPDTDRLNTEAHKPQNGQSRISSRETNTRAILIGTKYKEMSYTHDVLACLSLSLSLFRIRDDCFLVLPSFLFLSVPQQARCNVQGPPPLHKAASHRGCSVQKGRPEMHASAGPCRAKRLLWLTRGQFLGISHIV